MKTSLSTGWVVSSSSLDTLGMSASWELFQGTIDLIQVWTSSLLENSLDLWGLGRWTLSTTTNASQVSRAKIVALVTPEHTSEL